MGSTTKLEYNFNRVDTFIARLLSYNKTKRYVNQKRGRLNLGSTTKLEYNFNGVDTFIARLLSYNKTKRYINEKRGTYVVQAREKLKATNYNIWVSIFVVCLYVYSTLLGRIKNYLAWNSVVSLNKIHTQYLSSKRCDALKTSSRSCVLYVNQEVTA